MLKRKCLLPCISLVMLTACGGSGGGSNETEFDTLGMLTNIADNIIEPTYQDFSAAATQLAGPVSDVDIPAAVLGSIEAYCTGIDTAEESNLLEQARTDWSTAMGVWQQAELWLVGPVEENSRAIRNRIYSFGDALFSACFTDESVVKAHAEGDNFNILSRFPNNVGLPALEYLLFNDNLATSCPADVAELATWNSLPEVDRRRQRCSYAQLIAEEVQDKAQTLLDDWQSTEFNYRTDFLNPNNAADSIQVVSDALFYLDKEIKDLKLSRPLGITFGPDAQNKECTGILAATSVDAPYSLTSYTHLENNLRAFLTLYTGGEGLSFDDIVLASERPDFNDTFIAKIQTAIDFVAQQPRALRTDIEAIEPVAGDCEASINNTTITEGVAAPYNLYALIKAINDDLKADFLIITALNIPDRAQSDND